MRKATEIIERLKNRYAGIQFLPTGFPALDADLDGGFLKDELVVIGGFTGIGKSFFAAQIFLNLARTGFKASYISLEITNEMIVSRLLGQLSDVRPINVLTGRLNATEKKKIEEAETTLMGYEGLMSFYDNLYRIEQIKEIITGGDNDCVIIDFIQNVTAPGADEYSRLSRMVLDLQELAKKHHVCIVLLSQVSNEVARRMDKSPLEYKGSGAIATVADLGFFLIRDESSSILELLLRKNRRGNAGMRWQFGFAGEGGKLI